MSTVEPYSNMEQAEAVKTQLICLPPKKQLSPFSAAQSCMNPPRKAPLMQKPSTNSYRRG